MYIASAAPPVRHPNVYGIDMPAAHELVAHGRNEEEVAEYIGADWLIYQDLEDLVEAVQKGNRSIQQFDCSCFDGSYVTSTVNSEYLERISVLRNDSAKAQTETPASGVVMDLYNNA